MGDKNELELRKREFVEKFRGDNSNVEDSKVEKSGVDELLKEGKIDETLDCWKGRYKIIE